MKIKDEIGYALWVLGVTGWIQAAGRVARRQAQRVTGRAGSRTVSGTRAEARDHAPDKGDHMTR